MGFIKSRVMTTAPTTRKDMKDEKVPLAYGAIAHIPIAHIPIAHQVKGALSQ